MSQLWKTLIVSDPILQVPRSLEQPICMTGAMKRNVEHAPSYWNHSPIVSAMEWAESLMWELIATPCSGEMNRKSWFPSHCHSGQIQEVKSYTHLSTLLWGCQRALHHCYSNLIDYTWYSLRAERGFIKDIL